MRSMANGKEVHGKWGMGIWWATTIWLGCGVYLFATVDAASFLSWQAPVYFVVGMFVAALVFGAAAYLLQRGVAKILARMESGPSSGTVTAIKFIGLVLFAVEFVVIFFVARWFVIDLLFS